MIDAMKLWDGLFACDPTIELAQWVCVAMLIRIRNELIPADYSGQLTVLLRYPSSTSPTFEGGPHHTTLLLRQALALQMSPTASTGASLVLENRNLLNIPVDVPAASPGPQYRRNNKSPSAHGGVTPPSEHSRQATAPQMGLPEMIARGLMERGESLGINKTLMTAVSEFRRNIPDLAASLVRSPSASQTTFALTDERPVEERPPWEPRSRFEMERDISEMRSTNKRLGTSLEWIVDVLLQDEGESADPQRLKKQKQEALESLSYIRDILIGSVDEIEEERLVGEQEMLRRRSREGNAMQAVPRLVATDVPPPPRVPVTESRPHITTSRSAVSSQPVDFNTSRRRSASPRSSATGTGINRVPPWHYARSGFSTTNEVLPRLPPAAGQKSGDHGLQDPLGVLG
ncbi:hypothetical protein H0H81_001153 [Sphagnurus paluster]|uniref:Uncharacterized protein n=1 Tax=Sphagnurus paluster TaxID=117069 RepID=A0A9P7GPM4_9AGAR|nr:hypothetical protein H0H81_001153 [Sphagnurus paluster]